jgi:protein-S-isoprenylcysteine O-methyltransferase Ste14
MQGAVRLFMTIAGMAGFRLDRLPPSHRTYNPGLLLVWGVGLVASAVFAWLATEYFSPQGNLAYFAAVWVLYYIGNSIVLKTRLRLRMIRRLGEEKAYQLYEIVLGLAFANQALAFGVIVEERWFRWPSFALHASLDDIGLVLMAVGFLIKLWATMIVGLDIYYYKDMFLGRSLGSFARSGPYKVFRNPMYGIGHLYAYGLALLYFSLPGLIAAAVYQASIYLFYLFVERPAVHKLYGLVAKRPVWSRIS